MQGQAPKLESQKLTKIFVVCVFQLMCNSGMLVWIFL